MSAELGGWRGVLTCDDVWGHREKLADGGIEAESTVRRSATGIERKSNLSLPVDDGPGKNKSHYLNRLEDKERAYGTKKVMPYA